MEALAGAPQILGSYRILAQLGRGGMGVVYRAEHIESGHLVALKTVAVPRAGLLSSLRREIRALARIRHPGIVRILDEGVEQGVPWYAMELIEGQTLREHCRGTWDPVQAWGETLTGGNGHPEPADEPVPEPGADSLRGPSAPGLRTILSCGRQICRALAYLHGEGIVHRDLKPSNLLVRADGSPVLVDFGLMSQFAWTGGREELFLDSPGFGTAAYMAPEQIRGETLDARADLYSFGCVLYELLTGRTPFVDRTVRGVLQQHLHATPAPPTERVRGLSAEIDELILRLLAKRPEDRFGYADDVAAALVKQGVDAGEPGPAARAYLYRPRLAGRVSHLAAIAERVSRLQRGEGGMLLVGGESGAGKTRLLLETAKQAQAAGFLVLSGECLPPPPRGRAPSGRGEGATLQALRRPLQAVADRCREHGIAETERLFGRRAALLSHYEPAVRGLPGQPDPFEPVEIAAEKPDHRLFRAIRETFEALAKDAPIVLLLDDLQWADELSLGFVEFLLAPDSSSGGRLLTVATYRTEEVPDGLAHLLDRRTVSCLDLGRLNENAIGSIVSDMLAMTPTPSLFVRFLSRQSEGNPFFVAEYMRAAIEAGVLYRNEAGHWHVSESEHPSGVDVVYENLPLPRSLEEVIQRRIGGLSPTTRRLLDVAAVLGREQEIRLLAEMSGLDGEEFQSAIGELLTRHILEEQTSEQLRFVHDKLREVAYAEMTEERRRSLHQAAAERIEAATDPKDRPEASLARHWERAAVPERAREYYFAAGQKAALRGARHDATRFLRACLALRSAASRLDVQVRLSLGGLVLVDLGRMDEAIGELELALDDARQLDEGILEAEVLQKLGAVYKDKGDQRKGSALYQAALEKARGADARVEGVILEGMANLAYEQGRMDEALELYETAIEKYRSVGLEVLEAKALGNLAAFHCDMSHRDLGRSLYDRALVLQRKHGMRRSEGMTLGNYANLFLDMACFEHARRLYEEALAIHREVGNRRSEGTTLSGLADLHADQGRHEAARVLAREALAIHREVGNRRFEAIALGTLAASYAESGLIAEAEPLFEAALRGHREIANLRSEGMILIAMSTAERRQGHLDRATQRLADAEVPINLIHDPFWFAVHSCESGHLALAQGGSAESSLKRANEMALQIQSVPQSELGRKLAKLQRAQDAARTGATLIYGECAMDFPQGFARP